MTPTCIHHGHHKPCPMCSVVVRIAGMRLVSLTNARMHHMAKARLARGQRKRVKWTMLEGWRQPETPAARVRALGLVSLVVTITRIGPRALDSDNLAASGKHVRDGVADALGVDDGDPRITWLYAQEKGPYGVRIEIREAKPEERDGQDREQRSRRKAVKCKVQEP